MPVNPPVSFAPSSSTALGGPQFGGRRWAPNQRANAEARRILRETAQEWQRPVDRDLQRKFHDLITGENYSVQELRDVAQDMLAWEAHHGRRNSRKLDKLA